MIPNNTLMQYKIYSVSNINITKTIAYCETIANLLQIKLQKKFF